MTVDTLHVDELRLLEAEAVHIIREVVAELERPVLLFSAGKDSIVLLRLAEKAFRPGSLPFPVMHVDTGHNFDEVVEFRTTVSQTGALRRLALEVELAAAAADPAATTAELVRSLREALGLNVPVEIVGAGTLPRFEMKARRFVIQM